MKVMANKKVIQGLVALFLSFFVLMLFQSKTFRQNVVRVLYAVTAAFSESDDEFDRASSTWDKLRGKRTGSVRTLADVDIASDTAVGLREAARSYVTNRTKEGRFAIYDEVSGELLELRLVGQHQEISKSGEAYRNCFDFEDQSGREVDLDIYLVRDGDGVRATRAELHEVDGQDRRNPQE